MTLKKTMIFGLVILFSTVGIAEAVIMDYYIIVEENGNSLVILTISGSGLVNIPIKQDVDEIKVQGALYSMNNNSFDISIGSTEQAVVLYKTSLLTEMQEGIWNFNMDLTDYQKNQTVVAIPNNTNIKSTSPKAFVESSSFKKLIWDGNVSKISIEYSFDNEMPEDFIKQETEIKKIDYTTPLVILSTIVVSMFAIIHFERKKKAKIKNKNNIMNTLPDNENKIVELLIKNKGEIKRSKLEKITGIAKSSLAASLKNLEKKKIIQLDKTYKSHYIKLTKWFDEL